MTNQMTNQRPASKILRRPEVLGRIGISTSTLYAWVDAGTFPAPIQLGAKAVGWIESEIDEWISDRASQRPHQ